MQIQADFCCLHLQTHHLHEQELVQNEHSEWMLLKDQLTPKKAGFQVGWTSPDKLLHLPHTAGWGPQSNFSCSCSTLQRGPASSSAPSEQTHSRASIQPLPSSSCCYITHTSLCHWLSSPGYKYHLTLLILITFHFPPSKIPNIFSSPFTASFHAQLSHTFLFPHCPYSCIFSRWGRQLCLLCTRGEAVLWEHKVGASNLSSSSIPRTGQSFTCNDRSPQPQAPLLKGMQSSRKIDCKFLSIWITHTHTE